MPLLPSISNELAAHDYHRCDRNGRQPGLAQDPLVISEKSRDASREVFNPIGCLEAAIGIEPMNKGFADLCLTTWLRRPRQEGKSKKVKGKNRFFGFSFYLLPFVLRYWSGRRDLNSRPSPWQGDALPLSYSRFSTRFDSNDSRWVVKVAAKTSVVSGQLLVARATTDH